MGSVVDVPKLKNLEKMTIMTARQSRAVIIVIFLTVTTVTVTDKICVV